MRQKVHAPAYASFGGASNSGMIDLYEVLDLSEVGVALQCSSRMKVGQQIELSLDLAEARGPISTPARVVWSNEDGRVGLSLSALNNSSLHRLQEWLFLNAMAAAANAASSSVQPSSVSQSAQPRPNYPDTLTAASAVQREAESLSSDLEAILSLVASRSQSLLRASGAAIALADKAPGTMICRASAGFALRPWAQPCKWVQVFPENAYAPEEYCAATIPKPTTAWTPRVAALSTSAPCLPPPYAWANG